MPKSHPTAFRSAEAKTTPKPAHLYIVEHDSEIFHLCNYDEPIVVTGLPSGKGADPQTFTPAQIMHEAVDQSSDIGSNTMNMSVGLNQSGFTAKLQQMVLFTSPAKVTITIVRVNTVNLPEAVWGEDTYVVFKGLITNLAFGGGQLGIALISIIMRGEGKLPRFYWQKSCQHDLYGTLCGANPDAPANRIQTTVAGLAARARSLDIADLLFDATPIEPFMMQGGIVTERQGSYVGTVLSRITIVAAEMLPAAAGVRLFLAWWSPTLATGSLIEVRRGCRRILVDCASFHGSTTTALPFGGHPWIPDISPAIHGV